MTTTIATATSLASGDLPPVVKQQRPERQGTDVTVDVVSLDGSDELQGEQGTAASPSSNNNNKTDDELLAEGIRLCKDDQLLPGYRLFQQIQDQSLVTDAASDEVKEFYRRGQVMTQLRADLTAPVEEGWTKQGESHGSRDFITYYRIEGGGKLYCRIESVIEASLYVPLLATLNETDLYDTWFPSWTFPFRMGLSRSQKLQQTGRVEQVVHLCVDLPFPLNKREIIFHGFADEDCDANRNSAAKLVTVDESFGGKGLVPPPEKGAVRMILNADFMFRRCPDDHPALNKSKGKYPEGENLMLCTFVLYADPKIGFVPQAVQNFCARTAIGTVWRMLLGIAEDVREGKRPAHKELIASKREDLYDWVDVRAGLISGMIQPSSEEQKEEEEEEQPNNNSEPDATSPVEA